MQRFLLLSLSLFQFLFAQEMPYDTVWVNVEGFASTRYFSVEEAKKQALSLAYQNAVEKVCGVQLRSATVSASVYGTFGFNNFLIDNIFMESEGRVIDAQIPMYTKILSRSGLEDSIRVSVMVKVARPKGSRNKGLSLKIKLNKKTFRDGEELVISVRSTENCYVTLFNIWNDTSVCKLFPNPFSSDNFVKANQTIQIPSEMDRNTENFVIQIQKHGKKEVDQEAIFAVATLKKIPFDEYVFPKTIKDELYTFETTLFQMNRWLVSIPLNERIEEIITYQVVE